MKKFSCFVFFFDNKGLVLQIPVPKDKTVTGNIYKVEEVLRKSSPQNGYEVSPTFERQCV
jgi:hypothetical protein